MTSSMEEAMQKVLGELKLESTPQESKDNGKQQPFSKRNLPESLEVSFADNGNLLVCPIGSNIETRLRSSQVLFLELRRKVRDLTGDLSWSVRYASKIDTPLLPFLHCSSSLEILIDPMAPYRRPVDALAKEGVLVLLRLKSSAYYFKTKEELIQNPNMSGDKIRSLVDATTNTQRSLKSKTSHYSTKVKDVPNSDSNPASTAVQSNADQHPSGLS